MIKNDRQYRITKAAAAKFEAELQRLEAAPASPTPGLDPLIQKAERDALRSQLDELQADLRDYEYLVSSKVVPEADSIAELPETLVRARIAAGLTQRELAERLGLKEQQIQRYESTDYQHASVARLVEVASALGIGIRKDYFSQTPTSAKALLSRLSTFGLTSRFVMDRLVPRDVAAAAASNGNDAMERLLHAAARSIEHVFGWTPAAVLGGDKPWLNSGVLGAARFKVSASAEQKYLEAYTFYAHFLALLLLRATAHVRPQPIPTDPGVVYEALLTRYGAVSFHTVLLYCWDLGVPVLPLTDPGAFHAACWRVDGRNVIVLKQRTRSLARWLFDLLHDLRHAGENQGSPSHEVIESEDLTQRHPLSEEEQTASWFAGEVSLGGKAEALAAQCAKQAGGSIESLKRIVPAVAREAGVDTAALANYMAFRLTLQGENWWGAATNLQQKDDSPWELARDILLQRADLSRLTGIDRELFISALRFAEH
jgi:transcriptional regulator with XRE-family HTH domain